MFLFFLMFIEITWVENARSWIIILHAARNRGSNISVRKCPSWLEVVSWLVLVIGLRALELILHLILRWSLLSTANRRNFSSLIITKVSSQGGIRYGGSRISSRSYISRSYRILNLNIWLSYGVVLNVRLMLLLLLLNNWLSLLLLSVECICWQILESLSSYSSLLIILLIHYILRLSLFLSILLLLNNS